MCLKTTLLQPMVADKDIICYKVLRRRKKEENSNNPEFELYSYYYPYFMWEFDKIYHTKIESDIDEDGINMLTQGFHSYMDFADAKQDYENSYISAAVVRCIIPKGCFYYIGFQGYSEPGYVSTKLIIKEIVDYKELYPSFNYDTYPYKIGDVLKYEDKKDQYNIIVTNIIPTDTDTICIRFLNPSKFFGCCLTDTTGSLKCMNNYSTTGTLKR